MNQAFEEPELDDKEFRRKKLAHGKAFAIPRFKPLWIKDEGETSNGYYLEGIAWRK